MPKLVPYVVKTLPPKKPIHQRLGQRDSICESIHTSQMKLFRPNKFKVKNSVQNRLGKGYVNPYVRERGRIALHHLQTFAKKNDAEGQILLNAIKKAIKNETERELEPAPKYDMSIQKEISYLQVSQSIMKLLNVSSNFEFDFIIYLFFFVGFFQGQGVVLCLSRCRSRWCLCHQQRWTRLTRYGQGSIAQNRHFNEPTFCLKQGCFISSIDLDT